VLVVKGQGEQGKVGGGVKWGCRDTKYNMKWPFLSVVNRRGKKVKVFCYKPGVALGVPEG
jgi:hypothetical protein